METNTKAIVELVTYPNGLCLSVQWGKGNYSSIGRGDVSDSPSFETAAWWSGGKDCPWFIPELNGPQTPERDHDCVQGYQTVDEVLATALIVSRYCDE